MTVLSLRVFLGDGAAREGLSRGARPGRSRRSRGSRGRRCGGELWPVVAFSVLCDARWGWMGRRP
eukprot:14578954-Alexandrium_andersonii.AAC.1